LKNKYTYEEAYLLASSLDDKFRGEHYKAFVLKDSKIPEFFLKQLNIGSTGFGSICICFSYVNLFLYGLECSKGNIKRALTYMIKHGSIELKIKDRLKKIVFNEPYEDLALLLNANEVEILTAVSWRIRLGK
jgi:hypothetical protein